MNQFGHILKGILYLFSIEQLVGKLDVVFEYCINLSSPSIFSLCYLVEHGYSPDKCIDKMVELDPIRQDFWRHYVKEIGTK